MVIPIKDCPKAFLDDPATFANEVMVACALDAWPLTSFYGHGRFLEAVGSCRNIRDCTRGLLADNMIDTTPFSPEVEACLPAVPWTIPEAELAVRRDFRADCVFSIDPPTARDVDDALSCTPLPDGGFEVGVHIADVSHFVQPGTPLDAIAAKRATTTYLIQEAFPMLPRLLCDDLCSLLGGVDRLAFSVVWRVHEGAAPRLAWMGKSVIRSCAKLTYGHAYSVISGQHDVPFPEIAGFSLERVHADILNLHRFAQALRKARFADGSLRLDNPKLSFEIDAQTGDPTGVHAYVTNAAHQLVEEFMLLANSAVARRIHEAFPAAALLRHHPPPVENTLAAVAALAARNDIDIDYSSSQRLHQTLVASGQRSPVLQAALTQMLTRSMQLAQYLSAGAAEDPALLRHYALSVPLYTHFTSPIRRYADIIVHRQLSAALQQQPCPLLYEHVAEIASVCNRRKQAARKAQDDQALLYLCEYVRQRQPLRMAGVVVSLRESMFEVLVPDFGECVRVDCEALGLRSFRFSDVDMTMTLRFQEEDGEEDGEDGEQHKAAAGGGGGEEGEPPGRVMVIQPFQELEVLLSASSVGLRSKLAATLAPPRTEEPM